MTLLTQKSPLNLIFYTDPSHGWLAVSRDVLLGLGSLALAISQYSYQAQELVFLEEDCDAEQFISELTAAGFELSFIDQHTDQPSAIRKLERFALTEAEKANLTPYCQAGITQLLSMSRDISKYQGV